MGSKRERRMPAVARSSSACGWAPEPARPSRQRQHGKQSMLLVVPGVADATRGRLVVANIDHLRPAMCIAFTHKRCGEDAALDRVLDVGADAPLAQRCDVIRAPNGPRGGYVQHLKRVLPSFIENSFDWVFVLLDDVNATALNVGRLIRIARHNRLAWASPAVDGAHDDTAKPRNVSELQHLGAPMGTVGRIVRRIEAFAWLMTPAMYRCLHTLIDPDLNGVGWGYDNWLYLYCKNWPSLEPFSAGIVDSEVVVHGVLSKPSPSPAAAASGGNAPPPDEGGGGGGGAGDDRSAAILSHTYARKEALEAMQAMQADMLARGQGKMHPVDARTHGWLSDPARVVVTQGRSLQQHSGGHLLTHDRLRFIDDEGGVVALLLLAAVGLLGLCMLCLVALRRRRACK